MNICQQVLLQVVGKIELARRMLPEDKCLPDLERKARALLKRYGIEDNGRRRQERQVRMVGKR